ncbi:MAG: gliding motility-associated ABC transporter permease subunit GldF [Cyclobacteriaceae bacterium]
MREVIKKEFNGYLHSFIAYVVIAVFLVGIGLLMWVFPETSVLDYGYADMDTLFSLGPYVFIFLIPAITMKSFAEEKKMGTLEVLLTKPLTDWEIVIGKYLACFLLVCFSVAPSLVYYFSLHALGSPVGNLDTPGIIGSYFGLVLLAGVFSSVGVFSSALTANQIVSFIVAGFLCMLIYAGFDSISSLISEGHLALAVKQLGVLYHYDALSKGLIDSRNLVYFISVIGLMLLATKTLLGSRQW